MKLGMVILATIAVHLLPACATDRVSRVRPMGAADQTRDAAPSTPRNDAETPAAVTHPSLRAELLERMAKDQRVRQGGQTNELEMEKIDADNTAFMRRVIEQHGWPGKSMVGSDGGLAVFFLVQHAASDIEFQKKCHALMEQAVAEGEARADLLAYLTDRVLIQEGKPQRFGTQLLIVGDKTELFPIEDEASVDARREEVGLPPLEDYLRKVRGQ